MNPTRALSLLVGSGLLLLGCQGPTDPDSSAGGVLAVARTDALASSPGVVLWPDQLGLCFTDVPNPDGGLTDFRLARAVALTALNETWGAASAIDFTDLGDCPASPARGVLAIKLLGGVTGYGNCGYGLGASCAFGADSAVDGVLGLKGLAVHEVGHGLGFGHEHQRAFANTLWEGVLCAFEAQRLQQANQVLAAGTPLCFQADGCPGGVGLVSVDTAREWRDNRVPTTLNKLTPYDNLSIMNYCASAWGRTDHLLSDFDRLGVEMLYPGDRNARRLAVRSGAAFQLADRILSRSDVPLSLVTDWTARGALDEFFTGMAWWLDGRQVNTTGVSGEYFASTDGVRTASVTFTDAPTSRSHSGSTLLETSNAKHTALLMTLLP